MAMGSLTEGARRATGVRLPDDFSCLLPISQEFVSPSRCPVLYRSSSAQQRNAKSHFSKTDAAEFNQQILTLKAAWNAEVAATQFEDLRQHFESRSPCFIREIRKKRCHYLAFLNSPDVIRRFLSTTNVVEAVNGQLEIMRRNIGCYFHSEQTLKWKLGLASRSWKPDAGAASLPPSRTPWINSTQSFRPGSKPRSPHPYAFRHKILDKRPLVPESQAFLQVAFERGESAARLTAQLLRLLDDYGAAELAAALHEALDHHTPRLSSVAFILARRHRQQQRRTPLAVNFSRRPDLENLTVSNPSLEALR